MATLAIVDDLGSSVCLEQMREIGKSEVRDRKWANPWKGLLALRQLAKSRPFSIYALSRNAVWRRNYSSCTRVLRSSSSSDGRKYVQKTGQSVSDVLMKGA
jgi:hypothetical protein